MTSCRLCFSWDNWFSQYRKKEFANYGAILSAKKHKLVAKRLFIKLKPPWSRECGSATLCSNQCLTSSTDQRSMAVVWSERDVGVVAPCSAGNSSSGSWGSTICKGSNMSDIPANSPLSPFKTNMSCKSQSNKTQFFTRNYNDELQTQGTYIISRQVFLAFTLGNQTKHKFLQETSWWTSNPGHTHYRQTRFSGFDFL